MAEDTLRARHKRATENAIERAAVELALAQGHTAVTVTAICARADVSRSTFFNYMPSREAALFGRPLHLVPDAEAAAILAASADVPLTTALFRVIVASIGHARINAEVAAGRNRLLAEQPETQALILAPFLSLTTELTAFLAAWLGEHPARRRLGGIRLPREASLTVTATVGAFQALIADVSGEGDVEATEAVFTECVAALARITAAG